MTDRGTKKAIMSSSKNYSRRRSAPPKIVIHLSDDTCLQGDDVLESKEEKRERANTSHGGQRQHLARRAQNKPKKSREERVVPAKEPEKS